MNIVSTTIKENNSLISFDENSEITLQSDASMNGLGGVLIQNDKPVVYLSSALTDTEKGYPIVDKELLGITHIFKKLHYKDKEEVCETKPKIKMEVWETTMVSCQNVFSAIAEKNSGGQTELERLRARDVEKTLCEFDGKKASTWVRFITEWDSSNAKFKYDNNYILSRLKEKIKGDAAKLVQNKFHLASNVPIIINELQDEYGKPLKIYKELKVELFGSIGPIKNSEKFNDLVLALADFIQGVKYIKRPEYFNDQSLFEGVCEKMA